MLYLFLPPTFIWTPGHSWDRAVAVEAPTRPVPPNMRTRDGASLLVLSLEMEALTVRLA
jgi:hypothetical protein